MKQAIFGNWSFMRVFRLVIGLAIMVQAFASKDIMIGVAGLLFSGMAVFNVACCGMGGCPSSPNPNFQKTGEEISYEEIVK